MQEPSFEQLAAEAAAGLKADRELYLDVTQELRSHLEDKAAWYRRQGHDDAESAELSRKAFGSPLDVAADLLAANRGRMKLRALFRIAFGALIVPLAIVLAVYVGYGRFARFADMSAFINLSSSRIYGQSWHPPTLPLFGLNWGQRAAVADILRDVGRSEGAAGIHRYWEAHRHDPDGMIYYAQYALSVDSVDTERYVAALRTGERIEPQNALYNVLLAELYLSKGMTAQAEKPQTPVFPRTDDLGDRRMFELGLAELRKAASKPYYHTYQMRAQFTRFQSIPQPVLTEDYIEKIAMRSAIIFPHYAKYRTLARKVPGCARLLLAEGRRKEAMAVMDTWKPLASLLAHDNNDILIEKLVNQACSAILAKEAISVYTQLGAPVKSRDASLISERLTAVRNNWRAGANARQNSDSMLRNHASSLGGILVPIFGDVGPTREELTPGRMHEHVLAEEVAIQTLLCLLLLALLGTIIQGAIWLFRLRRAGAVPLLLMPPAREILRALLLGIALPMVLYWLYSRLPGIGGREFGWRSAMMPRFALEILATTLLMFWLPAHFIRRYIRRRCDDLGITVPGIKDERTVNRRVNVAIFVTLLLVAVVVFVPGDISPLLRTFGIALALGVMVAVLYNAGNKRREHGLYFGTLARSLAPLYAFAIIFLALTAQLWLLYNEIKWLRQDTVIFGAVANPQENSVGMTSIETRAAQEYSRLLLEALEGKDGRGGGGVSQ